MKKVSPKSAGVKLNGNGVLKDKMKLLVMKNTMQTKNL